MERIFHTKHTMQFVIFVVLFQVMLFGFFAGFAEYSTSNITAAGSQDEGVGFYYPFWQDVHVMMYIGFGFLLVYLGRHQYSSVGFTFLIGALCFQWSLLVNGFFDLAQARTVDWTYIQLSIVNLITSDYTVAALLISFSGVLGKLTPVQLLIMGFFECIWYGFNEFIGVHYFEAIDIGGSMYIHVFGCYFGLAIAMLFGRGTKQHPNNKPTYESDTFAMIGTLFLWMFWPSFNGALALGAQQHRVIVNTTLSLCCSCTAAFVLSMWNREGKLEMVDIQNASLAGGVAVGSCSDLVIQPFAACLIGFLAGSISVLGYVYLTPWLEDKIGLHDSAGINNLHGMPGMIGGLAGIFSSLSAGTTAYGKNVGILFPARAPSNGTLAEELGVLPGQDRTAAGQAGYQAAALFLSLALGLTGGTITGLILRIPWLAQMPKDDLFSDKPFWHLPESVGVHPKKAQDDHGNDRNRKGNDKDSSGYTDSDEEVIKTRDEVQMSTVVRLPKGVNSESIDSVSTSKSNH